MTDSEIIDRTRAALGEKALEVMNPAPRRIFLKGAPADLLAAVSFLKTGLGFAYLATISGVDDKEEFEILYHFADPGPCVTIRVRVPKSDPRVDSITPLIPGAILYEREIQEMFGLVVAGIPDPRRLVLPDDWPADAYPLRKDWKFTRPEEKIPGGKS
jgi:Ni,Fe-hydrogenase III component G